MSNAQNDVLNVEWGNYEAEALWDVPKNGECWSIKRIKSNKMSFLLIFSHTSSYPPMNRRSNTATGNPNGFPEINHLIWIIVHCPIKLYGHCLFGIEFSPAHKKHPPLCPYQRWLSAGCLLKDHYLLMIVLPNIFWLLIGSWAYFCSSYPNLCLILSPFRYLIFWWLNPHFHGLDPHSCCISIHIPHVLLPKIPAKLFAGPPAE